MESGEGGGGGRDAELRGCVIAYCECLPGRGDNDSVVPAGGYGGGTGEGRWESTWSWRVDVFSVGEGELATAVGAKGVEHGGSGDVGWWWGLSIRGCVRVTPIGLLPCV